MSQESDEPDVEIGAVVKAKKLRFKKAPQTEVEFEKRSEVDLEGEEMPEIETASGSKRENLPDEVEPGVTYRDVHIRWGAAARIKMPRELEAELEEEDTERE
jgi:hypothetical protein